MANEGKREAALAIWPWRDVEAALVNRRRARQRHGVVRAGVAIAVSGLLLALGHRAMAEVAGTLGVATLLLALLSPEGGYARLQRALDRFAHGVGLVLTFVVLTPVYLLVMTPFGVLLRHGARDPLHRAWSREQVSYWSARDAGVDTAGRRKRPF